MLIPGTQLGVSNDKNGVIYLLDLDKLGGFQARAQVHPEDQAWIRWNLAENAPLRFQSASPENSPSTADAHNQLCRLQAGSNSQIPQTFNLTNQMFNAPAYASGYMYVQPKAQPMLAYQVRVLKAYCPQLNSVTNPRLSLPQTPTSAT